MATRAADPVCRTGACLIELLLASRKIAGGTLKNFAVLRYEGTGWIVRALLTVHRIGTGVILSWLSFRKRVRRLLLDFLTAVILQQVMVCVIS